MGSYRKLTVYDAPATIASQIIDGEWRSGILLDTFFHPERLTPEERDSYITRLQDRAGGNPIARALIGVAANPLTWMLLITSPAGLSAIRETGSIFKIGAKYNKLVDESAPFLSGIGAPTGYQAFEGTPIPHAHAQFTRTLEAIGQREGELFGKTYAQVQDELGLKTLDYFNVTDPAQQRKAKDVSLALQAYLEEWDRTWTQKTAKIRVRSSGAVEITRGEEIIPARMKGSARELLRRQGGDRAVELADKMRQALIESRDRLFMKDGKVDSDKLVQLYWGLKGRLFQKVDAGDSLFNIRRLFGSEVMEAIEKGNLSVDDFKQIVAHQFSSNMPPAMSYVPRSIAETTVQGGRVVNLEEFLRSRTASGIRPTPSSLDRRSFAGVYHPDDLETFKNMVGDAATDELKTQIHNGRRMMEEAALEKRPVVFHRVNPARAINKYLGQSARTYALHVEPVGEMVLEAQERLYRMGREQAQAAKKEWFSGDRARDNFVLGGMEIAPVDHVMRGGKGDGRFGAWTLADALEGSTMLLKNQYSTKFMTDVLVPTMAGRLHTHEALFRNLIIHSKAQMARFTQSKVGQMVAKSGSFGQKFIGSLQNIANLETDITSGTGLSNRMAEWLYASHLGLNVASMTLNILQPMLTVLPHFGVRATALAYADAVNEIGQYLMRSSSLKTPIDRATAIKQTFAFADVGGRDLIGVTPHILETLDSPIFGVASGFKQRGKVGSFLDTTMVLFETSEMLNRSVTAHAIKHAYKQAAPHIWNGDMANMPIRVAEDLERYVHSVQFGSHPMNTMAAFMTAHPDLSPVGRALSNPLGRQFLNFQTRQALLPFTLSPLVGGGDRYFVTGHKIPLPAALVDVMRGLAVSSVALEAGRSLMGLDLSPALYAGATGQIFTGRFSDEDSTPIPLPPAASIPWNLVRSTLGTEGRDLLASTLPRLAPGGVALSKMIQVAPPLPDPLGLVAGQKRFVDYRNPNEDGSLNVYTVDGRLVDKRGAWSILAGAFGINVEQGQEAELNKYILNQQEQFTEYRSRYLRALVHNNLDVAERVDREFKGRYGFPIPITKQQIQGAIQLRDTPRATRIASRVPRELRGHFQQLTRDTVPGQQQQVRVPLSPEVRALLRQRLEESRDAERNQPFEAFAGY